MITDIDLCIGKKIRNKRRILGMSQTYLAEKLGVTFQQIQKYEKGQNKITASRLFELANIMDVQIGYFFENCTNEQEQSNEDTFSLKEESSNFVYNFQEEYSSKDTIKFVNIYNKINDDGTKKKLLVFLKSIVENQK